VTNFYGELAPARRRHSGGAIRVAATGLPYSRRYPYGRFSVENRPFRPGEQPGAAIEAVTPNYFKTMFVPLRSGRLLSDGDGPQGTPVAVISTSAAAPWWPNEEAIGRRIQLGGREWITIVGVVGDIVAGLQAQAKFCASRRKLWAAMKHLGRYS
jgi:hypothetical protein